MATPTALTRIWAMDLRAFDATGRRGVFEAREAMTGRTLLDACAVFKARTGVTVTGKQLKQIAALSTKLSAEQLRRKLDKRLWEDRFARQFGRASGSTSVRSVSGGLPSLGRR